MLQRGSIVWKASRRPTRKAAINRVSDIATNVVRENRDDILESELNDDELDDYIKKMIQLKLVGNDKPRSSKKPLDEQSKSTTRLSLEERIQQRQRDLDGLDEDVEFD